jgi:hypothetical protein
VLDHNVTIPSTGTAWVTINEPGSVCDIALGSDSVIDSTILHALAGSGAPGKFRDDRGLIGAGAALALQTVTSGKLVESLDGTAVVATKTVTKTGLFAGAVAGDKLVILASCTSAGAAGATAGVYTISEVTSNDVAVLATAPGDGDLACYVVSGNPTCLAYLFPEGDSSGCIQWIAPLNNAASEAMVGGFTHILGGVTLATGDSTHTLANGTRIGQKKGFRLSGALTTQDYYISPTSAVQLDGSTALAHIEMDNDSVTDEDLLEWMGAHWRLIAHVGSTLS